ncbi:MAG TPA: quinone oxidoreductase [Aliidongia sp.]|uniref:quinone oxidoreductase family protein n=1 Tax=Aliidongia sp. TaxID=1914230 RepID=UPI002DDD150D|nr:quinone oxidoreductase [Aliidongia sp.]HEV2677201.1 quinone oxidoreductase [Aliidongia sp.]
MTKARAVVLHRFGAPEVMQIETYDLAAPGVGEVLMSQSAVGFNYIDIYQRSGVYPLPTPTGLGHEAAGVVEAVGPGVDSIRPGDRVAYMNAGLGAYTDKRIVPAAKLVKIPPAVSDEAAAALLFKGMTAQYLLRKTHVVQPGEMIIVHAAAGGVGQILSSWGKALGAFVVGTAGSPEKCDVARTAGCDIAIDYSKPDWVEALLEATSGRKARVVYDSVGKTTFLQSLDLAVPFGLVVSYGAASGSAPEITMDLLNKKGCLYVTRPSVFPHNADPAIFRANAAELFAAIASGAVRVDIGARFELADIAEAHRAAEARATTGAILITP